jgi:Ca2+-binding RTX toxin-like protein
MIFSLNVGNAQTNPPTLIENQAEDVNNSYISTPRLDVFIEGTLLNDNLKGGTGNDGISGDNGDDKLLGNNGDDDIDGGKEMTTRWWTR